MILLIDSYDSFTNNLSQLVSKTTKKEVIIIHNDSFRDEEHEMFFKTYLPLIEYVIIGPGPGNPSNSTDVGIIGHLLKYLRQEPSNCIPVLGICLGFQSICYEFGNPVSRLTNVKHGQVYSIYPCESENVLFANDFTAFDSVRYHSLYVESLNDEMIPLAYCYEPANETQRKDGILMAARHKKLPFYGVQYHPESICSSKGSELVENFDLIAAKYNSINRVESIGHRSSDHKIIQDLQSKKGLNADSLIIDELRSSDAFHLYLKKISLKQDDEEIKPLDICDFFYKKNGQKPNFFLLNSAAIPGEWSIVGFPTENLSEIITHSVDDIKKVFIHQYCNPSNHYEVLGEDETIWNFIGKKMSSTYISRAQINEKLGKGYHSRELPFFGGYIGLISYEEGQYISINKLKSLCEKTTPDLKLIFIERFLIYDHFSSEWFIISCNKHSDDSSWVNEMHHELLEANKNNLLRLDLSSIPASVRDLSHEGDEFSFMFPSKDVYEKQFGLCQEYLHAGDSYELCLTTQSKITVPSYIKPWEIYKVLTQKNASSFSGFLEFEDCVLISSSPERFLSWKDNENGKKAIELKPIKGTVRKTPTVKFAEAQAILKTSKEMGENLMIVDLIRHDLHQFSDNVTVPGLMVVEENKTVFSLVSTIRGEIEKNGIHGIDILHFSLPPGSMTGAPKKRSIEILQDLESMQPTGNSGGRRGIYSGVVGYWSVTDDSDWAVVIRSLYHYVNEIDNQVDAKVWRIGAGGAITVLSDLQGEWDEMITKLTSALQAFQDE